jgi:predicted outer membrane repeat protein
MKNLLVFFTVVCLTVSAFGTDRLVPSQYSTIQMAIDASLDGDSVTILPGYYSGPGNYELDLHGKALIIQSVLPTDRDIVESTIIDCLYDRAYVGIRFQGSSYATTIIDGLTFWGGSGTQSNGGIIYCSGAGPTIRNCVFEFGGANSGGILSCDNHSNLTLINCTFSYGSATFGGAIYSMSSKITAQNCEFISNSAADGAAIYLQDTVAFLTDCNFSNNQAIGAYGGALYADYKSQLIIKRCDFTGNYNAGCTASAIATSANINLENCKIIGNTSMSGPAVLCGGGSIIRDCLIAGNLNQIGSGAIVSAYSRSYAMRFFNCTFTQNRNSRNMQLGPDSSSILYNSIIWPNVDGSRLTLFYSDCANARTPSIGNINKDPLFVDPGSWQGDVFIAGDYRLQIDSPCINAGNPNYIPESGETDIDSQPRIKLGRIDMGAYEGNTHPMDIDQDGIVNFLDFSQFAQAWLWKSAWHW